MNWKFWKKEAVIVPKDGTQLTQNNPLRAGLYERDVKDLKQGLEKVYSSLDKSHEDAQTFIDNVLDKETALAEATDAKMDYLNTVDRVEDKLNKIGSSILTLIDEMKKQSFKRQNIYPVQSEPKPAGESGTTSTTDKNAEKSSRTKFPKQEKDHPLFSAAETDGSGKSAGDSSEESADMEARMLTTLKAEFSQFKLLFQDTVKEFKALRADLRESNSAPGLAGDSETAVSASNSFVTGRMAQQISELSKLSTVPEALEEIKRLLAANSKTAAGTNRTSGEREFSSAVSGTAATATAPGKSLRVAKVNEKTESLTIWKWLEDNQTAARPSEESLLLLIEQSGQMDVNDLKAIRQECTKQNIFYITSPRDTLYALKNLGTNWNGKLSDEYIGSNSNGKKISKPVESSNEVASPSSPSDESPSDSSRASEELRETNSAIGESSIPDKNAPTVSSAVIDVKPAVAKFVKAESSEQKPESDRTKETASQAIGGRNVNQTKNLKEDDAVNSDIGKNGNKIAGQPQAVTGELRIVDNPRIPPAIQFDKAAANAETVASGKDKRAANPKENFKSGDAKPPKPRAEFAAVKLKEGSGFENLERASKPTGTAPDSKQSESTAATGQQQQQQSAPRNEKTVEFSENSKDTKSSEPVPVERSGLGDDWQNHFSNLLGETAIPVIEEIEDPYE